MKLIDANKLLEKLGEKFLTSINGNQITWKRQGYNLCHDKVTKIVKELLKESEAK